MLTIGHRTARHDNDSLFVFSEFISHERGRRDAFTTLTLGLNLPMEDAGAFEASRIPPADGGMLPVCGGHRRRRRRRRPPTSPPVRPSPDPPPMRGVPARTLTEGEHMLRPERAGWDEFVCGAALCPFSSLPSKFWSVREVRERERHI